MKKLGEYYAYLTEEQKNAKDALYGYLLELAVKDYCGKKLVISKPGHIDVSMNVNGVLRRIEIKQNGGDFRHLCKGNSYVAYAVFIDPEADLAHQLGYFIPMPVFREAGFALNHIRAEKKCKADGVYKTALQTLYNYKQASFHGVKAFKLIDMWEAGGAITFKDMFGAG